MAIDFDKPTKQVISPKKLAHVVLRTNKFKEMINFYTTFLGGQVIHEGETLAFISYDDEHHRIAIISIPDNKNKDPMTCGLDHIAFTFDNLSELLLAYRQRKSNGMLPLWSVNHGPTTSLYYSDPDGNKIETQVDNFDDPDDATEFMKSKYFVENPLGTDFDPEDYIERLKKGESEASLKKRKEIGPRGLPDFF